LKVKSHKLLPHSAFILNLRRYTKESMGSMDESIDEGDGSKDGDGVDTVIPVVVGDAAATKVGRCRLTLSHPR
jgi:hypothetical protein